MATGNMQTSDSAYRFCRWPAKMLTYQMDRYETWISELSKTDPEMARSYAEIVGDLLTEAISKGYVTPDKVTSAAEVHIRTGSSRQVAHLVEIGLLTLP
ncbi:hypothetical protein [Nocardia paucivorans]|uniref:hypothetical protein n=1 Tax=Nocardia paucivorans TaxID=114259 RepID=UPI0012FBB859|nr:hypothetical protein [Nocardia paucivorans]